MKKMNETGLGGHTLVQVYTLLVLFSVPDSSGNIYCLEREILMSSLSDLLFEYDFVRNVYLVTNDQSHCHPDFETVFGEHGISFEVYGFSSFNQRDFYGTEYLRQNLLIIYDLFQTKQISAGYLNETLLENFPTILYASSTKQVSRIFHGEVNYEMLLLHPYEANKTVLWHIHDRRWRIKGTWSGPTRWTFPSKSSIPALTLNGRQLIVATLPGFQFSVRHVLNGTVVYSGIYINYLDILAQILNFTYITVEPEDLHYGSDFDGDGQYDGIIGMAQKREIDIGLAPFTQTADRRKVVDYLEYFTHSGLGMLMKRPENAMTFEFFAAFKPFKLEVWGASASAVVLSSFALWLFLCLQRSTTVKTSIYDYMDLSLYRNCLRFFTEVAFGQGGDFPGISHISVKTLVAAVVFTFMFLRFTYMGHLISFLTVPKQRLPANTLKELAEQETHKVGVLKSSSHEILFRTATSGYFRQIWNKIQSDPGNLVEGLDGASKARNEKFIYVTEDFIVTLLTSSNCDLVRGEETFLPRYLGPITSKNWPFTKIFNDKIAHLRESGVLDLLMKKYITSRNSCGEDRSAIQLGLGSFKGVFTFLAGGCFVGSVVFIIEKKIICQMR